MVPFLCLQGVVQSEGRADLWRSAHHCGNATLGCLVYQLTFCIVGWRGWGADTSSVLSVQHMSPLNQSVN